MQSADHAFMRVEGEDEGWMDEIIIAFSRDPSTGLLLFAILVLPLALLAVFAVYKILQADPDDAGARRAPKRGSAPRRGKVRVD